jgi:hypothetical protein
MTAEVWDWFRAALGAAGVDVRRYPGINPSRKWRERVVVVVVC